MLPAVVDAVGTEEESDCDLSGAINQVKQEHPNKKRAWAGARVRVQCCGQRLSCSMPQRGALLERLQKVRRQHTTWAAKQWELVVKQVGEEDWGAVAHGGARTKKAKDVSEPLKLEHSAIGEHAIVASALDGEHAKVPSAVGEGTCSAVGEKPREEGQVAGSVVGEEQASEEDVSSVIAECGSDSHFLPTTLPSVPTTKQRIAGYRVIEIINSGSFGDVYKALNNSSGELSAVEVMQKCRNG